MIAVENVSKSFGNTLAVDRVSFEVKAGETLVLLGTSGSGKTTMLRMINRLLEPTSGNISLNHKSILAEPPEILRRNIGYVLQGYGLFPHYTVAENIAIVPSLLNWGKDKIYKRVNELLQKLRLPPEKYADAYPHELSGGQKQRVGLARALAANPPVLLMDEPFGALDPLTRESVRKEFKELDELKAKTIILVTHDVQEAFELGDKICLMDKGAVVQSGTPADLIFHPVNEFVKSFFSRHELQLRLQALRLKDIWRDLLTVDPSATSTFTSNKNIWEATEALTNKGPIIAYDPETGTTKKFEYADLQIALKQIKNNS
ncbi:ABC transporter ATP-binding protein [Adhaeribacter rhizoryzae]|uniref:ABC transporter ATP-binding protein n=1 Tax=Adhaeribacter rhizoryzae TaxID=2607907 RepID=A0A5M6DH00_9BACT|nr:ABC transporter ATP-binding protein [Adhaeribacter rhizoryzae]KAA5546703.1 ABC transporter ATP-binding protein [Adhaeribacter rhizoryzae]